MGGSLGLALKRRAPDLTVVAYARRSETREAVLSLAAADVVVDSPEQAARGSDLVVLCVPVLKLAEMAQACLPGLGQGAVVTDVGSTKHDVIAAIAPVLEGSGAEFVGSHPIAGSEETGIGAAREDLYTDATVVVTPLTENSPDAVSRTVTFWEILGSRVQVLSPQDHDAIVARTSHLPHLVAAALAGTVCRNPEDISPLCGSGFRDTTRIASGSAEIWHDIVRTNCVAIRTELDAFTASIEQLRKLIDNEDYEGVRQFLDECRARRMKAFSSE
jgi:prephenate dehydrogenase